jgi:hypothetical protein
MRDHSNAAFFAWREYQAGRGAKPDTPNSLGRHERKCTICKHPDREAIEQEFLRWYAPEHIAQDHDVPYASAIYRHAHAKGLFQRRRRNLRLALEPLIEQANTVEATAGSVIRAVRTYAHINDAGNWIRGAETGAVRATKSCRSRITQKRKGSIPRKRAQKSAAANS